MGAGEGWELRIVSGKCDASGAILAIGAKSLGRSLVHAADLAGTGVRKTIRIKIN
jgi:hypothetical protein